MPLSMSPWTEKTLPALALSTCSLELRFVLAKALFALALRTSAGSHWNSSYHTASFAARRRSRDSPLDYEIGVRSERSGHLGGSRIKVECR